MIATNTTRFLVTHSTRLRAALRRVDPYTAGSLLLIALIIAGGLMRGALESADLPPIVIYATPAAGGQHGSVRRLERAPSARGMLPTAIVPTAAPLPTPAPVEAEQPITIMVQSGEAPTPAGYIAHTTAGDAIIPDDATRVPDGATYDGPFLAPATEAQPTGPRFCTGFGDWRDYDAAYATSPACHPIP